MASEVVNDANDSGQLHEMAQAAKDELGAETLTALADTGYYNGNALKACEEGRDCRLCSASQARCAALACAQTRATFLTLLRMRQRAARPRSVISSRKPP